MRGHNYSYLAARRFEEYGLGQQCSWQCSIGSQVSKYRTVILLHDLLWKDVAIFASHWSGRLSFLLARTSHSNAVQSMRLGLLHASRCYVYQLGQMITRSRYAAASLRIHFFSQKFG